MAGGCAHTQPPSHLHTPAPHKHTHHPGAIKAGQRVVLVDDLVATGGTLQAGVKLVEQAGGQVVEAAVVIELPDLKGRDRLPGLPLFVLIEKEGL